MKTPVTQSSTIPSAKSPLSGRILLIYLLSMGAICPLVAAGGDAVPLLGGPAASLECAGGEPDALESGVKLFLNRDYTAKDVPVALRGLKFIRNNLESVHAVCRKPGVVYVLTPSPDRSQDSLSDALLALGFEKANLPEFVLFRGGICSVYQKQMVADEPLDLRKWGVLVAGEAPTQKAADAGTTGRGTAGAIGRPTGDTPVQADALLRGFIHPPANLAPGKEYDSDARKYQGIPSIERAPGGRLWAAWYAGKIHEDQYNYVVAATSGDGGVTWSDLKLVIDPDGDGPKRAADPCLWLDPEGKLWLFWWLNGDGLTATMAMTTDNPDAENPVWSEPRALFPGVMLNKPIVTKSGEWLMPAAIWGGANSSRVMVSDDRGKTWALRGAANIPADRRNCDEHMLVERKDGSLWMLARTAQFGISESVSTDGGRTWTEMKDYQPHTTSRFYLGRLKSGNLLLIRHGALNERSEGRNHLTAYLSDDDGATWKGGLLIDERESVSYPDAAQSPDGTIYAIYDWSRLREKNVLMSSFTEGDILAGAYTSPAARSRVLINQATGINPKAGHEGTGPALREDKEAAALKTGPRAKLTAGEGELRTLDASIPLFCDQSYILHSLPQFFYGKKFVFAPIGRAAATCVEPGMVYAFTPRKDRNAGSVEDELLAQGFERTSEKEFFLRFQFDKKAQLDEACSIYQKQVSAGEKIQFGNWGLLVF